MAYMVKRPGSLAIQTFSREELAARAARGDIKRDWLVREDGGGEWARLDEIFDADWPAESVPTTTAPSGPPETESRARNPMPTGAQETKHEISRKPASGDALIDPRARWTQAAMKRYRDAYRVAAFNVAVGGTIKTLGIVGCIIFGLLGFAAMNQGGLGFVIGIGAIVLGATVGAVFFIWGIVVSAGGQKLQAELDVAVYESPFLDDEACAKVMSL